MRRPVGIWIIVAGQTLLGLGMLLGGITNTEFMTDTPDAPLHPEARVIYVLWALISFLFAFWLWRLERRGWVLTMTLTGFSLTANIALWWLGEPDWVRMGIQAVVALYLNSVPVRQLFLPATEHRHSAPFDEGGP
jgi:hypothetical protein